MRWIGIVVVLLAAAAASPAQEPVRDSDDPAAGRTDALRVTAPVLREQMYRLMRARFMEAYDADGHDGGDEGHAVGLIDRFVEQYTAESIDDDYTGVARYARKHELIEHPSPVVRAMALYAISIAEDRPPYLWEAAIATVPALAGTSVPRVFVCEFANEFSIYLGNFRHKDEQEHARVVYRAAFIDAVCQPGLTRVERRFFFRRFEALIDASRLPDDWRTEDFAAIDERFDRDPWLDHALRGVHEVELAWDARGGKFASQTSERQFKNFAAGLARAREHLLEAYRIDPEAPEAAATMIKVSMGGGDPTPERVWFERATAAQRDYGPAFSNLSWAMRPRWNGSYAELRELAIEWSSPDYVGTRIPGHASSIVYDLNRDFGGRVFEDRALIDSVIDALERSLADPLQSRRGLRLHTDVAVLAFYAGRYDTAARHCRALDGALERARLRDAGLGGMDVVAWALPADPASGQAHEAHLAERGGAFDRAAEHWDAARSEAHAAGDVLLARACASRATRLERQRTLDTGAWVDITFDEHLSGLLPVIGASWEYVDERTVRAVATRNEGHAVFDLALPEPIEIELVTRFDRDPERRGGSLGAGVVVGVNPNKSTSYLHVFGLPYFGNAGAGYLDVASGTKWGARTPVPTPEDARGYHMRVRYDSGELRVLLNGEASGPPRAGWRSMPWNDTGVSGIGFGRFNTGTRVEFSNIRIRRAPALPDDGV